MALPSEYEAYLKANLNWFERLSQVFSALDERIDYTNILLTRLLEAQGAPSQTLIGTLNNLTTALNRLADLGLVPALPNRESFIHGARDITTAGTAEQLTTASISIPDGFQLTIIAKPANTGTIYIGRSKGDAEGSQKFDGLSAGLAHSLIVTNVNLAWVNTDVDGEGVSWIVEQ